MTYRSKIAVTLALLLILGGVGAADMLWSEPNRTASVLPTDGESSSSEGTPGGTMGPAQGVAKRQAPDVPAMLQTVGFTPAEASDPSMLQQIVGSGVNTAAVLKDGDRVGAVVWVDSPQVKSTFNSLKDALLASFSPNVTELRDETKVEPGLPVRNELTFLDPGLSEERLLFIRVGERLMEFHIAKGKENDIQPAIDALSTL